MGQLIASADLETSSASGEPKLADYAMLAAAYHKIAEANEGLREWGKATFAYTQAYEVLRRSLGPDHHLTRSFEQSSRCPHPIAVSGITPPLRKVVSPRVGRTPRRLPCLSGPSRPWETGALQEFTGYDLSSDSFPSWPPRSASSEEQAWYSMARSSRKHSRLPPVGHANREPKLEPYAYSASAV